MSRQLDKLSKLESRQEVGKRLRELRILCELTQKEVASKMGFAHSSSLKNIEKGQQGLDVDQLKKFGEIYGMSTDYILFGDDEDTHPATRMFERFFLTDLPIADRKLLRECELTLKIADEEGKEDLARYVKLLQRAYVTRPRKGKAGQTSRSS